MRDVEDDEVVARALELGIDGAGDDVARREVAHLVIVRHEGLAVAPTQDAALAADRFGDQERFGLRVEEAGRVELHEFHVRERGAGAVRHRHAVARGDVGVARVEVDLAGAARREQRDRRRERVHLACRGFEDVGAERAVRLGAAGLVAVMRSIAQWSSKR